MKLGKSDGIVHELQGIYAILLLETWLAVVVRHRFTQTLAEAYGSDGGDYLFNVVINEALTHALS